MMTEQRQPQDGMHPEVDPAGGEEAKAFRARKKTRNGAIMVVLLGLAVIFYAITILKMRAQ